MNPHKIYSPIIEVRGNKLEKKPEYVIKGKIVANIPDHYGTLKTPTGKKALRSVFTENALKSMARQAKTKKIFVDAEHKTAAIMNVKHYLDQGNIDPQLKEAITKQLEMADLPLGKVDDLYLNPDNPSEVIVETRLNPHYRDVDENHAKYFDAVWSSINDKFINKISFDFAPTKVSHEDGIDYIDDVMIYGIDYTGGGALAENSIFEVAMRATQEFIQTRGNQMEQEEIQKMKAELEAEKARVAKEREEIESAKRQAEIEKQKEAHQKELEEIKKEITELKKLGPRGIAPQEDKYASKEENKALDDLKYQKEFRELLQERVQIKNAFPNREDLWKAQGRKTNPDGDLTLGHLLALHADVWPEVKKQLSPDSQSVLGARNADINLGLRK